MRRSVWAALALFAASLVQAGPGLPTADTTPTPKPKPERVAPQPAAQAAPVTGQPVTVEHEVRRLSAAEVVPADCRFFVSVPDMARVVEQGQNLAIYKAFQEPVIRAQVADTLADMGRAAQFAPRADIVGFIQMVLGSNIDYMPAMEGLRREVAIVGLPDQDGATDRVAVIAAVGNTHQPLDELLDSIMGEILMQYPQFTAVDREHRGTHIRSLSSPAFHISFAYFENLFIVATGRGAIVDLLNVYDTRKRQMSTDDDYRAAAGRLAQGSDAFYKVDLATFLGFVPGLGEYSALFGASATVWGSIRFDGAGIRERVELTGGADSLAADSLLNPPKTAAYFPVDTVFCTVFSIDPAESLGRLKRRPEGVVLAEKMLKPLATHLRIDPEGELLPVFGGEIAFGVVAPVNRPLEFLLALEIQRTDMLGKATASLDALISSRANQPVQSETYREHVVRSVARPEIVRRATVFQTLAPGLAYATRARDSDVLLIASSAPALRKAIRQQQHGRSAVADKADYLRVFDGLRTRRSALVYLDTERCMGLLAGAEIAQGIVFPGPLAGRLDATAVASKAFGTGAALEIARGGFQGDFHGPVGPLSAVAIQKLRGSAKTQGTDEAARIAEDSDRLRSLGVALQLYATDFDRFPQSLSELYAPHYLDQLSAFEAPGGRGAVKTKDDIDTRSDYVYTPGLSPSDLSDMIITYTKSYVFRRGRSVLFLDGRVSFIEEPQFQLMIANQTGKREQR